MGWSIGIILFLLVPAQAEETLFPAPPAVQRRINFWIRAFTEFGRNQIILHDAEFSDIIYDVVDLGGDSLYNRISRRARWHEVEGRRREIKTILKKLAGMKMPIDVDQLSAQEREIYDLWAPVELPLKFMLAEGNLHAQMGLKELFYDGLERSGRYLDTMKVVFRQYDLPEDLCYLPHVESAFNYRAYSKMGAAGIWQFTRSTGRLYLKIDYAIDERYDPFAATDAAARLMRHNYGELGSWPLAITAYNHGTNGMARAKETLQTDDIGVIIERYNGRAFGFASKNFYAEFLAAMEVAKSYEKYFGQVQFEQAEKHQMFEVPSYITLDALCRKFSVDKQTVAKLNPALRHPILKSSRRIPRGYHLRLPLDIGLDAQSLYAQLPAEEKHDSQVVEKYYQVEPGDNLGSIARQFGTTVAVLVDLNNIADPRSLRAGQLLEMPESSRLAMASTAVAAKQEAPGGGIKIKAASAPAAAPAATDTTADLLALARYHAGSDNSLYGPKLTAEAPDWEFVVDFEEPVRNEIVVQSDETIGHLAEWLGIYPSRLRELNHLASGQPLQVGRRIKVEFTRATRADFHRRRLEFHRSLQEDFFTNYRINGIRPYLVKNGDSVWDLCQRILDVPYWLLSRYNKNVNLLNLQPGQVLNIPILLPLGETTIVNQTPAS